MDPDDDESTQLGFVAPPEAPTPRTAPTARTSQPAMRPVAPPVIAHTTAGTSPARPGATAVRASGTHAPHTLTMAAQQPASTPVPVAALRAPVHSATALSTTSAPGWDGESRAGIDLAPGTRIKQYELIRELGAGGMGVVYAARDLRLGRRVAMKFLRHVDREVIDRFLVEARATAQCNHDNIVIIYEVDEWEGMPYMVLELVEGRPLRDLVGPLGDEIALPSSRVIELMLPIARALVRAHELGIVHRDLKPENVLVSTAGQVKVLDFGIAKALGAADHAPRRTGYAAAVPGPVSLTLTAEGAMVGTLPYMSPEQLGVDEVDHRSDLFAAGVMMFEMLAGRHPVEPLASDALIGALLSSDPLPSIRTVVPDLPELLIRLVDGCLRKSKAARIGSAAELARGLEQLLPGRTGRQLADGESPYPGLTAFQEQDANRFFGRARDITRMVARVRELPLSAIIGPSGVGKSSFIRAGVGPALKASGETWDVVTLRPGRHPLAALASVIERLSSRTSPTNAGRPVGHEQVLERLRTEPGYLGVTLRARATATGSHMLLFIDQFEELYTLVPDAAERQAFTAALGAVADDTASPLRVVVSMRSDFLDRVGENARFMEELSRGLVFLSAPDREGLREALEQPVEMVGFRYEHPGMVSDMLDALAHTPGALPLLQFAAAKLWDARDRDRRLLTQASYQAIGGITGALATHADEVVRNMDSAGQRLTQTVFRQLVTPERTRAIVELADLRALSADGDALARVIDQLVAARLLVVQTRGDGSGGSVEIVHESLIDRWPALRRWLDEDQEDAVFLSQLAAAAKQWDARQRPAGLLWRGDAGDEARRWYALRPRTLPPREQAFIDGVIQLYRRGRRARRGALGVVFVALAGIAGAASIAYVRMSALEEKAQTALGTLVEEKRASDENLKQRIEADKRREAADKERAAAEAQRIAAEQDKLKADQQVAAQSEALAMSREELMKKNAELDASLRAAMTAQKSAEVSMKDAQKAKAALEARMKDDSRKMEAQQRELEQMRSKLTTKLKGLE